MIPCHVFFPKNPGILSKTKVLDGWTGGAKQATFNSYIGLQK
jgi:hypothetical protein